jgi:ribosomal protein S18 acetylase RimI-like enzyme
MPYPRRMAITVRTAAPADRARCLRLLTAQLVEHALPADPAGVARGVDLALAPRSAAWLLLAEREGEPVGVLLASPVVSVEKGGLTLWVEELYVAPEARRRGVATAVLDHLSAEARRRGMRAVELEVVPTQAAAFALYRRRGFREVHRQRMTLDLG